MFITYLRPAFITGLQFLAIGTLLRVGFGLDTTSGVLRGAAIVLGYTLIGGQFSAITSQWLQSLLQHIELRILLSCFLLIFFLVFFFVSLFLVQILYWKMY